MKLTEKQGNYKNSIIADLNERLSFIIKNDRRKEKYAWQIKAIEVLKNTEWINENFGELVYFHRNMKEYDYEDMKRLWKANKHTVNIF